ncbi:hypothetical protein C8R45DRAFT_1220168 [Mycena sanguinolenta]|nr:hypothetical protein C8R45DRAFT_1220168 [Mycena sanguinolenta]
MASVAPAEERELLQLLLDSQTTNYLAAAGFTVLVFEHISTFPEEVKYVWQSRVSLWSVLYVWIRYYTLFAVAIDVSFMFREIISDRAEMITATIDSVSVDCILVLRVWILYGKPRNLMYFLVPLMAAEIIALLTIGTLSILPAKGCYPAGMLTITLFPLSHTSYEAVPRLFGFYAVPLLTIAQHLLSVRSATRMPVVTLFLRDGVFLFLTILVYTVAEIIIWNRGRQTLVEVPIIPAIVLHAIIGARILLNIKNLGTEVTDGSVPTMHLSTMFRRHRTAAAKDRSLLDVTARLPNVHPVELTAGDKADNKAAIAEIQKTAGQLDIVILNAVLHVELPEKMCRPVIPRVATDMGNVAAVKGGMPQAPEKSSGRFWKFKVVKDGMPWDLPTEKLAW